MICKAQVIPRQFLFLKITLENGDFNNLSNDDKFIYLLEQKIKCKVIILMMLGTYV